MFAEIHISIGPGTHRLCLQGLERPIVAHLIGQDTTDIVLQRNHIDDAQISPALTDIPEGAIIAVAFEPGDRFCRIIQSRLDPQRIGCASVKLEQRSARLSGHHSDPIAAGPRHRRVRQPKGVLGGRRGFLCGVCADTHEISALYPGRKSALEGRRSRGCALKIRIAPRHLQMIAAYGHRAGPIHIISVGQRYVLGLYHRDLSLWRMPKRDKMQVLVKIPQAVPAACIVFQVCPREGVLTIEEPHLDGRVDLSVHSRYHTSKTYGRHKKYYHKFTHFPGHSNLHFYKLAVYTGKEVC